MKPRREPEWLDCTINGVRGQIADWHYAELFERGWVRRVDFVGLKAGEEPGICVTVEGEIEEVPFLRVKGPS